MKNIILILIIILNATSIFPKENNITQEDISKIKKSIERIELYNKPYKQKDIEELQNKIRTIGTQAQEKINFGINIIVVLTALFTLIIVVAGLSSWQIKKDFKEESTEAKKELTKAKENIKDEVNETKIQLNNAKNEARKMKEETKANINEINKDIKEIKDYKRQAKEHLYGVTAENLKQNSIDELKKKDKKDLSDVEKLLIEASDLQKDKKEEDAIKKWEAIIAITENEKMKKDSWFSIGYLYGTKKEPEYDKAIEAYNNAISNTKLARGYYNRGLAYANKEDYKKAIEDYEKAIRLDKNNRNAYLNRGIAYEKNKDFNKAIEDFNKAIKLDKNYEGAYNNRGVAYFKKWKGNNNKEDYKQGIKDYNKAIELDKNYAEAYYNRGLALANKKEYDKAITDFKKAQELGLDTEMTLKIMTKNLDKKNKR